MSGGRVREPASLFKVTDACFWPGLYNSLLLAVDYWYTHKSSNEWTATVLCHHCHSYQTGKTSQAEGEGRYLCCALSPVIQSNTV